MKGNESGVEGFMRAHPSDKDKDVARMGHPAPPPCQKRRAYG